MATPREAIMRQRKLPFAPESKLDFFTCDNQFLSIRFPKDPDEFLALLPEKKSEVARYARDKNLSGGKFDDLIKLVT